MKQLRPGLFGKNVAADSKRIDFDFYNEQLIYLNKRPDILFIGDSITAYWDLNAYFNAGSLIVNRGIGGDVSEYVLKRFNADVIQLKPGTVILLIGINDIFAAHDDPWWHTSGTDKETVLNRMERNVEAILEKCRQNNIKIALCSLLPSDIAPPYNKELWWELTRRFNEFARSLCDENLAQYIDYHSRMCGADGRSMPPELSPDGIHPNAKGYEIMADILKSTVDGLI